MTRQQETVILRLWRDWCKLWPEQYGRESLQVKPEGFDPVFDVIPSQTYKDFYLEVIRGHPTLKHLNVFEVIDTALNQVRAPESSGVDDLADAGESAGPARAPDHPRLVAVDIDRLAQEELPPFSEEADTA